MENARKKANDASNFKKEDGTYTTTTKDKANEYLIRKYFPGGDQAYDTKQMRTVRQVRASYMYRNQPAIAREREEIDEVISKLKNRKAASERIPNEAVREI